MPHPAATDRLDELRRQDLFAVAARLRPAAGLTPALRRRTLALLMAMVITGALSQATAPVSSFAASHVTVFSAETPRATKKILTTGTYDYRPAGSVRTVAQLTVPAGAHWKTDGSGGS